MASDRERYTAALQDWDAHIRDARFSVPSDIGMVALLFPYVESRECNRDEVDSYATFREETLALADRLQAAGKQPIVALDATPRDFRETLENPHISDVIIIGHGCLASVEVPNPTRQDRLDWEDLAGMATHLKTGSLVQRVCGTTPRSLNVPLGLMVVDNHTHVLAAVGQRIQPVDLDDPQNDLIIPVTSLVRMSYEDVKMAFPQRKLPLTSRAHVALGAMKRTIVSKLS